MININERQKTLVLFCVIAVYAAVTVLSRDSLGFIFSLFLCIMAAVAVFGPEDDKRFLLTTLLLAFLVRVLALYVLHLHSWHRGFEGLISGDDRLYSLKALKISRIWQHLPYSKVSDLGGEPYGLNAYTYLLAMIYRFFEPNYLYSKFFNCLIGSVTVLLVYGGAKQLFSSMSARIAMFFAAFYPSMIIWSAANYKDAFIIFLVALIFYCIFSMKKNIMSPFYIGLIVMSAFLLKNLQSLYVHALIGSVVVYAVIKLFRTLKDKVLITLTIVFFAVYCYSWYELTKPQLVQFVDFMTSYQNGMCRADSAGYAIYSDKVFEMIRRGDIYIAGIIAAYFKGLAHVLFSPFPWQITSSNQFFAYPQVVLWYCLLIFSIYGFAISFKNNPVKAAIAFLYLFLGISILALWEGNVGAAFRHRDYFAPIIFIFSSGAITKIYHKTTGDR